MKRIGNLGVWVMAGLQLGCNACSGASKSRSVVAIPDQERTAQVAQSSPHAVQPIDGRSADVQAHVFEPVAHPPHTFASYRPIPQSDLPRMVQRLGCFGPERDYSVQKSPPYYAPRPTRRSVPTSAGKPRNAPKGASPPMEMADGLGSGDRAGGGTSRPEGPKMEAPQPSPPPAAMPEAKRDSAAQAAAPAEEGAAIGRGRSMGEQERLATRPADVLPGVPLPSDYHAPLSRDNYHDWGASLYLSNDDTMSLSSAQRVLFAIDQKLPVPPAHIRPHEFLNYFSFDTAPVAPTDDFSVLASIAPKPGEAGIYTLGLSVSGRDVTRETRRNAGLTLVIDRSGSMAAEGRMEYLKQGLHRMTSELKPGDLVNLVLFDDSVCTPLENFVVGRDSMSVLERTISKIQPRGATNLNAGLAQGYRLANDAYRDAFTNRVVLISDALTNTGVTDPELIALVTESYDKRRVRLSGVGVGRDFNDELLDRLTEKGKGAYVFLGSEAEVDAVFGSRFISLIETVANDVHFRLHLPPSLRMNVFYGEESSTVKSDVQAIHYFAGTNQLFLSDLMARNQALNTRDGIMLSVEYENPETGAKQVEEFAFNLGSISGASHNLGKGRLLMSFIDGIKDVELAQQEYAPQRDRNYAAEQCANGRASLRGQADHLRHDPEVTRVLSLWQHYCDRYPEPVQPVHVDRRNPEPNGAVKRQAPRGNDVWPSAR